jgi:dTDP-4-amino-4,6-dideoxygalactose transaminase
MRFAVVNEFHGVKVVDGAVAEDLFKRGLCLPSGTAMTDSDMDRIIAVIKKCRK